MQLFKKASFDFPTFLGIAFCLVAILQYAVSLPYSILYKECIKKARDGGHSKKIHTHKSSESEEEDSIVTAPELMSLKGLASAGITYWKPSATSIPKCLGYDMRVDKIIQVTKYCEGETGEGKNETSAMTPRSLCFTACMFKFLGLIGEDLMFTSDIDAVVVDIFPPIAHPQAKRAIRSCAKQTILPLSHSDNCTSFGPVKGCILRNVQNICNGEYY